MTPEQNLSTYLITVRHELASIATSPALSESEARLATECHRFGAPAISAAVIIKGRRSAAQPPAPNEGPHTEGYRLTGRWMK